MGRSANRSPEQTRTAVLHAAAQLLTTHGLGVSLTTIAATAGVSKGGLLYHFAAKDDLFHALAQSVLDGFHDLFERHFDPDAWAPNIRAYVLACTAEDDDEVAADAERLALFGQLTALPIVAELARLDEEHWRALLISDGVPEPIALTVTSACDGIGAATLWGVPRSQAERLMMREVLLRLIDETQD